MKTLKMFPRWSRATACFVILILAQTAVHATPYATGLTNNAGVVSFRLNEPAGNVRIVYNGGANTTNIGALPAGLIVTNLGITGVYQIVVSNNAAAGWLFGTTNLISSDLNPLLRFPNGRGVAVNRNPASPYFGRVFVANSTPASSTNLVRAAGRGIYALNPDGTD
ncbi:MAG: hypothetical protein H7X97_09795, partial [Opitutaceae bacterium]|nr:hypothetical protein [Verrucomicrobiales bacterium]